MKSVLTRHPSDIYLSLRVPFESWWNKQASPVFKQHLSRGQAADEHSERRWCCLTPAHTREQTHAHTHRTKTCIPVFLSWMYSKGWMFSTQQCFILSECISSRRRISRLSYRCWQRLQPEDGAARLFYLFLYAHTCRVQWNSLRLRGGTLRISGLTLKMNVCHIKTLHGQGEILRVSLWPPPEMGSFRAGKDFSLWQGLLSGGHP